MSMMSELPVDLIEEILCRISATCLKRLRSTCKLWNRVFQDKRFASKHLAKAPKQGVVLLVKGPSVCSVSVNLLGNKPSVELKGELSLIDPLSSSHKFQIHTALHCDGLLLCTNKDNTRIVVWDPCTGQTRWIQPRDCHEARYSYYSLGSYKDNKSDSYSYKILYNSACKTEFEIYDINSNSWRILDVIPEDPKSYYLYNCHRKSLRGKTYWFAWDNNLYLLSFDYTTERFERLHLPDQNHNYVGLSPSVERLTLSVEREEKLCVLLHCKGALSTDLWVMNKTGDTWSRVLALDFKPALLKLKYLRRASFVVDEEKKVVMFCDVYGRNAYIVGEDNNIRQVDYQLGSGQSFLINYVPTLTQIQQALRRKRTRA